ncbi:MAG TPA: aldehyde dehydrogenase family protein [Candidatus Acidoferrales bacterium]|jgi:aldehyde dehydrogenase (NAD+)|nr:aldehyde dehydrogenase family protein [Candidatus Acidoferrales bacterium]
MNIQITKNVADFLRAPGQHFIGGRWNSGTGNATAQVLNPSDGTTLATVAMGGAPEIEEAVIAAWKAFPTWSALSPNERAAKLHRFAEQLEKHSADLALLESLDVGKAITAAEGFDVPFGIECLRYFANLSTQAHYDVPLAIKNIEARVHRAPYGVCGFVFPWNFPFTLLLWGIAPALAAGNTVVVKPSEVTPLSSLFAAKMAAEAGIPDGVINLVIGDGPSAGAALAAHPRIKRMSFTGSPEVGKKIGEACGRNLVPCKLELGGKGAAVVFDDVDVDSAAQKIAGAITLNTGQVCCTATRWLVHEKIYDRFVDKVVAALKETKSGPGPERETQMGPLVSETQRRRVVRYLENGVKEGAEAILPGGTTAPRGYEGGFYVQPSLLAGSPENVCCREEIFGPSAFLLKFKDENAAVSLVNRLAYGLANSVWSTDLKRAGRVAEQMVAGNSWINAHNVFAYGLPYGGINLSGFGGGVNSPETFNDYLRPQTIARPLA